MAGSLIPSYSPDKNGLPSPQYFKMISSALSEQRIQIGKLEKKVKRLETVIASLNSNRTRR